MMNIYLVIEDGESFCIKAETMAEAIAICETIYLKDREAEPGEFDREGEIKFYHEQILQSCSLIAELKHVNE